MRAELTSISIRINLSIDIYSTKLFVCKISDYVNNYVKATFGH